MVRKMIRTIRDLFVRKIDITPGRMMYVEYDKDMSHVKLCQKVLYSRGAWGVVQNVRVEPVCRTNEAMRLRVSFDIRSMIEVQEFK